MNYNKINPIKKELSQLEKDYNQRPDYSTIKRIGIAYALLDIETVKLTAVKPDKNECLNWFKRFGRNCHSSAVLMWYEAAIGGMLPICH